MEYKYVVAYVDRINGWRKQNMRWEYGDNRVLNLASFFDKFEQMDQSESYEILVEDIGFNQRASTDKEWPKIREFQNQCLENSYISRNLDEEDQ